MVDKGWALGPTHALPLHFYEECEIGLNSLGLRPLQFQDRKLGCPLGQPRNLSLWKVGWPLPSKVDEGLALGATHAIPLHVYEENKIGLSSLGLRPLQFQGRKLGWPLGQSKNLSL